MPNDVQLLADHCRETLDLEDLRLPPEYAYRHLPLAVIDAVYSIGVTYRSTRNTVKRFADRFSIERFTDEGWPPPAEDQLTLSGFLALVEGYTADELAEEVFDNRQRTSVHDCAILKAEATRRFAEVLRQAGVETFQDVTRERLDASVEEQIRALPGQTSGIGWHYFWMLAGETEEVKPDRMVVRYVEEAVGRPIEGDEARTLLLAACETLRADNPELDPRRLDYRVWQHQRGRPAPGRRTPSARSGARGRGR